MVKISPWWPRKARIYYEALLCPLKHHTTPSTSETGSQGRGGEPHCRLCVAGALTGFNYKGNTLWLPTREQEKKSQHRKGMWSPHTPSAPPARILPTGRSFPRFHAFTLRCNHMRSCSFFYGSGFQGLSISHFCVIICTLVGFYECEFQGLSMSHFFCGEGSGHCTCLKIRGSMLEGFFGSQEAEVWLQSQLWSCNPRYYF